MTTNYDAEILFAAGVRCHQVGQLAEAIAYYQKGLEISPENTDVLWNLAVAFKGMAKKEEAVATLRRLLTLSPNHEQALLSVWKLLRELGIWHEAAVAVQAAFKYYVDAINRESSSFESHIKLARFLMETSNIKQAIDLFLRCLQLNPASGEAIYFLGLLYSADNNIPEAIRYLFMAIKFPEYANDAQSRLTALLHTQGQQQRGKRFFSGFARNAPSLITHRFWQKAQEAWANGNILDTYRYCIGLRQEGIRHPAIEELSAAVAIEMGCIDKARDFLAAAAAIASVPAAPPRSPRYLLSRSLCVGFWGEVRQVVHALMVAEISGRIPVVFWGKENRHWLPGMTNAWNEYFEPVSAIEPQELCQEGLTYAPSTWSSSNLLGTGMNRWPAAIYGTPGVLFIAAPENVIVSDAGQSMRLVLEWLPKNHPWAGLSQVAICAKIVQSYIRPHPSIQQHIDAVAARYLSGSPLIAAHYRAQTRDKSADSAEKKYLTAEMYFAHIDKILENNPEGRVFLLTDTEVATTAFQEKYGERLISLEGNLRLQDERNLGIEQNLSLDGKRLAVEAMVDCYLAARCDYFIGDGASNVSVCVSFLKPWPEGRVIMLRKSFLDEDFPEC